MCRCSHTSRGWSLQTNSSSCGFESDSQPSLIFFGHTPSMWKVPGQRSNLSHSGNLSRCSDNARSLTCCAPWGTSYRLFWEPRDIVSRVSQNCVDLCTFFLCHQSHLGRANEVSSLWDVFLWIYPLSEISSQPVEEVGHQRRGGEVAPQLGSAPGVLGHTGHTACPLWSAETSSGLRGKPWLCPRASVV